MAVGERVPGLVVERQGSVVRRLVRRPRLSFRRGRRVGGVTSRPRLSGAVFICLPAVPLRMSARAALGSSLPPTFATFVSSSQPWLKMVKNWSYQKKSTGKIQPPPWPLQGYPTQSRAAVTWETG